MRGGRSVIACLAVAAVAALSSCGGLPTISAVQQGSLVGEQAVQPIRVQPDGPAAGATPDQIVRGFIRAGAGSGFDDDYAIARSFFTPNVKDDWQPDAGVEVFGDQTPLKVELLTPTTVRVTAPIVAEVDGAGHYRETPAGTLAQATFGVQKLTAGWRISIPQKGFGLWLGSSDLDRIYQPFTIAYVSTATRTIVGDRRWFPITSGLATTLARAQLEPVPSYLNGAVQTGVPTGTALAVDAVPIQSGLAVVDLSEAALSAVPDLRRAMWAQFVTTLMQVPSVTEVSLEVQGARLNLPGAPDRVSLLTTLGYQLDPVFLAKDAILRTGTKLSRVSPDRPQNQDLPPKGSLPASPALPTIPAGWTSLALSWDEREIAGVGGDHSDLARWQGTRMFRLGEFGTNLTKPSYDSLNGLWVAGQVGGTAKVWVIDTSVSPIDKAKPRQILVPWLAKRTVVALRVAGDNRRIALVTTNRAGGDVQLVVAGIIRSANGAAVSLSTEPLRVGWTLTAAADLAWVDDSTLSVVGRVSAKDAMGPQLVEIGGKVTALPPVIGARLVTNSGGPRGVVVITDRGQVLALAGNGWQQLQTGSDFLIPGE
jgi:Lipoprotein LpqB beta-propeller domain/Sporulation and spore germination